MKSKKLPWISNQDGVDDSISNIKDDKIDLFTFIKAIKGSPIVIEFDENAKKIYNQFIINSIISMNPSLVHLVNQVNMMGTIPDETHFEFYLSTHPKDPAYYPLFKKSKSEKNSTALSEYYEFGSRDRRLAERLLTEDQVETIESKYASGRNAKR